MTVVDVRGMRGGMQTARALIALREMVLTGELAPGQRVLETWLVERLGVSRTPVRAAIAKLHEEGFLEPTDGVGYSVRTFTEEDALDAIEVRGALEGLAARRAAERGVSAAQLRAMQRILASLDAIIAQPVMTQDDLANYAVLNEALHAQIAKACGGQTVPRLLDRVASMPFAHPSGFVTTEAQHQGGRHLFDLAQAQHRSLIEALAQGDGARADQIMREHARLAESNLRLALKSGAKAPQVDGVHLIAASTD